MKEKDFFGREEPLRKLTAKIFRTRYSGPASASLTGPPGIGKRALLNAAKKAFERTEHPDVFLIERAFRYGDTKASFLWAALNKLRKVLPEAVLRTRPAFTQTLWNELSRAFEEADKWNPDAATNMGLAGRKLADAFEDVMEVCQKLKIRVILILYSFDIVTDLEENDWRGIIAFLDGVSERSGREWNLTTLLVSERHPQFIARSALSGSLFQIGYPPITLRNFDDDKEMERYFDSFPGGAPDEAVRSTILRYCGRYPKFLIDFRDSAPLGQTVSEEQVRPFASQPQTALFHRLYTLLESQTVTSAENYSALDAFRDYFLGEDKSMMKEVYKLGLADMRPDGTYTPLTEYLAPEEMSESAFLAYLGIKPSPQSGVPAARDSVIASWLHLSDLHVSEEPDTRALLRQFKALSQEIYPDFMIVTGDFRDKASKTDFSGAERYLNKILEYFSISKENTYLVPGNHDAEDAATTVKEAIEDIVQNVKSDYHCYFKHLKTLYERFSAFNEFCLNFYGSAAPQSEKFSNPPRKPCGTRLLVWTGKKGKLNLLCANTALISDGDRNHQEITDLDALEEALDKRDTSAPTIMIGHHPFTSLGSHSGLIEDLFNPYNISAYLYGDIHEHQDAPGAQISLNFVRPSLSCCKSAPKSGDNGSDVGAVYYEWRSDGKTYVTRYQWSIVERKLIGYSPVGSEKSFEMILPPKA